MRRGFKTEANAIACEVRGELGLAPASPLDVWQLAEHLEIPVIPLSGLRETAPLAADLFLNDGQEMFSGVTVFHGSERTIVFNDAHVPGRQASDVGHELAHGLLLHPPGAGGGWARLSLLEPRRGGRGELVEWDSVGPGGCGPFSDTARLVAGSGVGSLWCKPEHDEVPD